MGEKNLAGLVITVGVVVILVTALADVLQLGYPGFGTAQIVGCAVGVVAVVVGVLMRRKNASS